MGITLEELRREAAESKQLLGVFFRVLFGNAVIPHALANAVSESSAGVKGLCGRLKNHLQLLPRLAQGFSLETGDLQIVQRDGAGSGRGQAGDEIHQGGLAAAGFPDEAKALAGVELEGHVLHRVDVRAAL